MPGTPYDELDDIWQAGLRTRPAEQQQKRDDQQEFQGTSLRIVYGWDRPCRQFASERRASNNARGGPKAIRKLPPVWPQKEKLASHEHELRILFGWNWAAAQIRIGITT